MRHDPAQDSALGSPEPGQVMLFGMDGGGRELIDAQIRQVLDQKGSCLMLEVGSFVGHSARRWLEIDERVSLICSDFFRFDSHYLRDLYARGEPWVVGQFSPDVAEAFFAGLDEDWGQLRIFLANLQQYRHRLQIFSGDFADTAAEIAEHCRQAQEWVDLVYLDADKGYDTLLAAHRAFPGARLMGDDWEFRDASGLPIQVAVARFCKEHSFDVQARQATWVLRPCSPLRLRARIRRIRSSISAALR